MLKRPSECSEVGSSAFLRSPSPVKLSRPQKRRRRLQLLAVHRARTDCRKEGIAEAPGGSFAKTDVHGPALHPHIDVQSQLQTLDYKVDQILNIILSCTCLAPLPGFMPCGEAGSVGTQYLNPYATEFIPEAGDAQETSSVHICDTSVDDEVCSHATSHESEEVDEHEIMCNSCGQPLDAPGSDGEYDGDRCDTCDQYLHGRCLTQFSNIRGEWHLCRACVLDIDSKPGIHSIRCDFRSLPSSGWTRIYNQFLQTDLDEPTRTDDPDQLGDSGGHQCKDTLEEQRRSDLEKVVKLRKTLDNHLDHMIKYLELDRGGRQPEEFRSSVLQLVRDTMAWKDQPLSGNQLDEKICELSTFMVDSLRAHALIS